MIAPQKQENQTPSNMSILQDLKAMKNNGKISATNPELEELPKTARNKKNILQADFDTDSENENNQNVPKIKDEQSEI